MKKFLTLSLLPLLVLVLVLEIGLRLAGYESPLMDPYASFVQHRPLFRRENGRLVTDPARTAFFHTASFDAEKPDGHVRFFVFGGSAVYGYGLDDPVSSNFCAVLGRRLAERLPDTTVEAINCGGICYASYRLVGLVDECLQYSPDFVVVASGHNEFLEPRHYKTLIPAKRTRGILLRVSRTAQLIQHGCARVGSMHRSDTVPAPSVLAPDKIDERYVVRDAEEYEQTRRHFARNLEKIVHMCREQRVPVVLCTLPSNLRDWPPFHSAADGPLPTKLMSSELQKIVALQQRGDHERALLLAHDVMKLQPRTAIFHYVTGQSLEKLGRISEARTAYELARDRDAFPHRALSSFNKTVRTVVQAEGGVLFDADTLFADNAPNNIPGNELFLDQCHPNARGHELLADGLLHALSSAGITKHDSPTNAQ